MKTIFYNPLINVILIYFFVFLNILKRIIEISFRILYDCNKIQEVFYVEKIPDNEKSNQNGDQGA